jgi:beta-galactosidase GanA
MQPPHRGTSPSPADARPIPALRRRGNTTQLVVDGSPFLVLGGELENSAASSVDDLERIWPRLVAMHLNTVLLPVYWELLEPEEGRLDFTLVDAALAGARASGLRLVLLWFGTWKNSMSTYVPAWVKADRARFPMCERASGRSVEILSPFAEETVRADARAFAALMRHLAAVDAENRTVIMVQVENEVGMLEEAADRSAAARAAFAAEVPAALLAPGHRGGSWRDVFGEGDRADETFMAYHFARYVERVTRAGKAEYSLPMFVNAALNRAGKSPGEYPGGGPLPHLFDVWRAGAPSLDFLAPDIYFPQVAHWLDAYARPPHPLFIPEIANVPSAAVEAFYAVGRHEAIGFSPFAIDTIPEASAAPLKDAYRVLSELSAALLDRQGAGATVGALLDGDRPFDEFHLGGAGLAIRHDYTFEWSAPAREIKPWPRSGALVLTTGPMEYLVAGSGVIVTFTDERSGAPLGLLQVDEGRFVSGEFVPGRRLNGDDTHQGRHVRLPVGTFGIRRVKLYSY